MDRSARTDGSDKRLDEQGPGGLATSWRQVVAAIRDEDKTPLVQLLLRVIEEQAKCIEEQAQRIVALEAEIARLKGPKKPTSNSKPSALSEKPAAAPPKELPSGSTLSAR